jgi:molybdopterin biosynthesis enzyme
MARSNLRIYRGPAEKSVPVRTASKNGNPTVTVNVGEVLPLLADAVVSQRTWLSDFEDDEITISADLYEVLLAYQYYRHPAA